ncbi:YczE/YyaS/YitT family protein [Lacticaseibacillus jixiensis]|uniref:YczE/YyaS/YitT family protein n=1 Tax=Lacticaseibacillus jixiensis TaxID=3231926 RepID=UPI0036F19933
MAVQRQEETHLSSASLLGMFAFSLALNGFGNGLTVAMNLGSALWTSSAVNLSHAFGVSLLAVLLVEGVAVVIFNTCVLRHVDWRRIIGNFVYMIPFSFLVSGFAYVLKMTPIVAFPLWARVAIDLFGILCIGCATSIYQRINVVLHPNDDFMQILRFHFLKGNAAIAQPTSFVPPIIIDLLCLFFTRQLYAVNIGTLFSLVAQGAIVGVADKRVFPKLKHRHLQV